MLENSAVLISDSAKAFTPGGSRRTIKYYIAEATTFVKILEAMETCPWLASSLKSTPGENLHKCPLDVTTISKETIWSHTSKKGVGTQLQGNTERWNHTGHITEAPVQETNLGYQLEEFLSMNATRGRQLQYM